MEFVLFLLVIALLMKSNDPELQNIGETILKVVLGAAALLVTLFVVALAYAFFPTATVCTLYIAAGVVILEVLRRIYKRFFSAQAGINRGYARMDKRWYALSYHVVYMENGRYTSDPQSLAWAVQEGEVILKRCKDEFERYKLLPPEQDSHKYRLEFYPTDINNLERRFREAANKTF